MNSYAFDPNFKSLLEERKSALEKLLKVLESSCEKSPDVHLRVADKHGSFQYYLREDPKNRKGTYIPKANRSLAQKLAQAGYNQQLSEMASREYKLILKYCDFVENHSLEEIYSKLHQGRKVLIDPLVPDRDRFLSDWVNDDYEPMLFNEPTEYYTAKEIRVRSKSELVIADLLEQYEVPYKYEKPLNLRGLGQIRPDFTCLNARTRKEYVWEHFGMMDNAIYANKNVEKLAVYQQNGFFPGKNMIATFESSLQPLSTKNIKATIREYLL